MSHLQLSLTYGRATLLSRALYSYLQQDYEGESTMLIFNTGKPYKLGEFEISGNKKVILINSDKNYSCVGDKYLEAIKYIPDNISIVSIIDDDDVNTPDGMRRALHGLKDSGKSAYKSEKSFFHYQGNITQESNNLEGSIFMDINHLLKYKFLTGHSVKYHDAWLLSLLEKDEIKVDKECEPYFIYDWCNPTPTYKISGLGETETNFQNSQMLSNDMGNGILIPNPVNYHEILQKIKR